MITKTSSLAMRMIGFNRIFTTVTSFLLLAPQFAWADGVPTALNTMLPHGYDVLAVASGPLTGGPRDDYVIAIGRHGDEA
ncbi:hypothetical protein [Acidisoma cladoniae]|uniref:hypothetical protein n=1 Tax=Acidisoma cladoniae TaxID=3040935 RepID=UPI00254F4709|nr:hypothetical protein [Acidisoma sp. PAMC 29798]